MNALRWLPGIALARRYDIAWLRSDLVAGIVMTTMLVPVGIAYTQASGVPGINGLYATIIPLLAYVLFGPSRILVLGPDCENTFFATLGEAVQAYLAAYPVEWSDWQDRQP